MTHTLTLHSYTRDIFVWAKRIKSHSLYWRIQFPLICRKIFRPYARLMKSFYTTTTIKMNFSAWFWPFPPKKIRVFFRFQIKINVNINDLKWFSSIINDSFEMNEKITRFRSPWSRKEIKKRVFFLFFFYKVDMWGGAKNRRIFFFPFSTLIYLLNPKS